MSPASPRDPEALRDAQLDFAARMQAISTAYQLLSVIEGWDKLLAALEDKGGTLPFRDPTLFLQTQRDPQWKAKVALIRAARDYVAAVGAVKRELEKAGRGIAAGDDDGV